MGDDHTQFNPWLSTPSNYKPWGDEALSAHDTGYNPWGDEGDEELSAHDTGYDPWGWVPLQTESVELPIPDFNSLAKCNPKTGLGVNVQPTVGFGLSMSYDPLEAVFGTFGGFVVYDVLVWTLVSTFRLRNNVAT